MYNVFNKLVYALGWVSVFSTAVIIGFFLAIDGQERYLMRKRDRKIAKKFDVMIDSLEKDHG